MSDDLYYEKEVSAKIVNNPEFTIPEPSLEDVSVASVSTYRNTVLTVANSMLKDGSEVTKMIKVSMVATTEIPFTGMDIIMSYKSEGIVQATVTAIGATGVSILFGVTVAALVPEMVVTATGVLTVSLLAGLVNYGVGKIFDGVYDYAENVIEQVKYNEQTKTLELTTGLSDMKDITTLIDPLTLQGTIEENIKLNQVLGEDITTYNVKPGDNIYAICQKFNMSYEELIEVNPWLAERFTEDKSYALIKPNEKLTIPFEFWNKNYLLDDEILSFLNLFHQSETIPPVYSDPLLIDLNGDGIKTTTLNNGTYFDHDVNGFAEKTSWVDANDGVLSYDRNNNGSIDNGSEIFGDGFLKNDGSKATSGYDALKSLDSNNDNIINSNDAEFNAIKILKGDGTLITLEDAGITSISLQNTATNQTDENGNQQLHVSSYTKTDGTTGTIGDYNFIKDPVHSISTNIVEVPAEISALPDANGYGIVESLHQAMAKDTTGTLKTLVQSFVNESNLSAKREILTEIIYKWSGVETIDSASRGEFIDAKSLTALEKFLSEGFIGVGPSPNPNSQAASFVNASFNSLREFIYAQMVSQTSLKSIYDQITIEINSDTQEITLNLSAVSEYIKNQIETNKLIGDNLLSDFDRTFKNLGLKENSNYNDFYNTFAAMDSSYKSLLDTSDKFVIYGTSGSDSMSGNGTEEAFFGGAGDDTIYSRQGNDIVYGEDGNDNIDACEGNDTVYGGLDKDTILGGLGSDLLYGGDGDDSIAAGGGDDTIYGGGDNDSIYGNSGKCYLDGGEGNDYIKADGYGVSTIIGGSGDDILVANAFNNYGNKTVFLYNKGDGNDIIKADICEEVISFGEGITKDNIIFQTSGDTLRITFKNIEGSITVEHCFERYKNIEKVEFADGTFYTFDEIKTRLMTFGTDGNDSMKGSEVIEVIYGLGGDDTINGNVGNDTIFGGEGNDSLIGGNGNCYLDGGAGNDIIEPGYRGNSTIIGGLGDDTMYSYQGGFYGDKTTYVYSKGDGNDLIYSGPLDDIISFGEDITKENILFSAKNYDLIISFKDFEGSITVKDCFDRYKAIELFQFADGSTYNLDDVKNRVAIIGTNGNDTLMGTSLGETIYGLDGDDSINAGVGNDTIYGGIGNDTIDCYDNGNLVYGESGNDYIISSISSSTIIGGLGDDTIVGVINRDYGRKTTCIYNLGDGNDTVINKSDYVTTIQLGEGITKENTRFVVDNRHIIIKFDGYDGSILIENCLSYYLVDKVQFSDGTGYTSEEILTLLEISGTEGNDIITGSEHGEKIYGLDGNDSIDAIYGNDSVYGGAGNDTINGVDGWNYLDGGVGDDYIEAGLNGHSTLVGGLGSDTLVGQSRNQYGSETTFVYNKGDGSDVMKLGDNENFISFGDGITKDDLIFTAEGSHMRIYFKDNSDNIFVEWGMDDSRYNNYSIKFADGSACSRNEIINSANSNTLSAMSIEANDCPDYISNGLLNQIIQDLTAFESGRDMQLSSIETAKNNEDLMMLAVSGMNS